MKLDDLPRIGLDTWRLGTFDRTEEFSTYETIRACVDLGFTVFDTSPIYADGRSETLLGTAIDDLDCRDNCFLSTKCGLTRDFSGAIQPTESDAILPQVESSLERLDLDRVDLLQLYAGGTSGALASRLEPVLEAKERGLTTYVGLVSSSDCPDSVPYDLDVITRPGSVIDYLQSGDNSTEITANHFYFDPYYCGLLTEDYAEADGRVLDREVQKYHPDFSRSRFEFVESFKEFYEYWFRSNTNSVPPESLALAWLLERSNKATVLVGMTDSGDVHQASGALDLDLSESDLREFESSLQGTIDEFGEPRFVQPPPLLGRHNYDRYALSRQKLTCRGDNSE